MTPILLGIYSLTEGRVWPMLLTFLGEAELWTFFSFAETGPCAVGVLTWIWQIITLINFGDTWNTCKCQNRRFPPHLMTVGFNRFSLSLDCSQSGGVNQFSIHKVKERLVLVSPERPQRELLNRWPHQTAGKVIREAAVCVTTATQRLYWHSKENGSVGRSRSRLTLNQHEI